MKHYLIIGIVFFTFISNLYSIEDKRDSSLIYSKLVQYKVVDTNKTTVLYFYTGSSCSYCIDEILSQLDCLSKSHSNRLNIIIYATGRREIEIKGFKRQFAGIGEIRLNPNIIQRGMGLKVNTSIAIISSKGEIISELDEKKATAFKICTNLEKFIASH